MAAAARSASPDDGGRADRSAGLGQVSGRAVAGPARHHSRRHVHPGGYGWLDELAAAAADRAGSVAGPTVLGHSDWYARNLRFADGVVVAAYDWESVIADTERESPWAWCRSRGAGVGAGR